MWCVMWCAWPLAMLGGGGYPLEFSKFLNVVYVVSKCLPPRRNPLATGPVCHVICHVVCHVVRHATSHLTYGVSCDVSYGDSSDVSCDESCDASCDESCDALPGCICIACSVSICTAASGCEELDAAPVSGGAVGVSLDHATLGSVVSCGAIGVSLDHATLGSVDSGFWTAYSYEGNASMS